MDPPLFWLLGLGPLLGLLCLGFAFRASRRRRLVENLPTSSTAGVFIGLVELQGAAQSESPFTSLLASRLCVRYSWKAEEHWSRTVTETYRDSDGKTRTRTRTESGWTTVASGGASAPFYLQDADGAILIRPEGAEIQEETLFSRSCGRSDPLYFAHAPTSAIAHSTHQRRFTESGIPLHHPLYVIGQARERQDVVAPEIARDPSAPLFLISTRSEDKVRGGLRGLEIALHLAGLLLWSAGLIIPAFQALQNGIGDPTLLVLGLVAAPISFFLVGALGWLWTAYNALIDLRQRVDRAWSLIDVELKRRHDLIPNLVAVLTASVAHERATQETVAALRAQSTPTAPGQPGPDPAALQPRLHALLENFPTLQTNDSFLSLQRQLALTEQRIALARGYFNTIATAFNTRLETIPENWVAALARLHPRPLLAAAGFERAPVPVTFPA